MSEIRKIYYSQLKLPVYAYEKQHRRGVKTPPAYRYGKAWTGSSGLSMELLKHCRNLGVDIEQAIKTGRSVPGFHFL